MAKWQPGNRGVETVDLRLASCSPNARTCEATVSASANGQPATDRLSRNGSFFKTTGLRPRGMRAGSHNSQFHMRPVDSLNAPSGLTLPPPRDGEGCIRQTIVCIQANEEGDRTHARRQTMEIQVKPAPVEPRGNVSDEYLNAVCGKLTAICFMWRLGLSAEEQQKPEAAAVLMGMFDAITQEAGVEQFTSCFRSILQAAAEAELSPLAVPLDDLLRRMIATSSDAKLLPWSFYATHKVTEMQTRAPRCVCHDWRRDGRGEVRKLR